MSQDISANNRRIAKNTLVLYVRMLFLMVITLYTSRVVISALGFSDYGIYNAVGGFVAMFGIISNSLTAAISRFITFEIGHGDRLKLNKVFSTSLAIQCVIAVIAILLMESVGVWFLNVHMTIPEERLTATNYVMQFSILTFAIQLISVPYNAAIIAHEKMGAFAAISIFNGLGTLVVAFFVQETESFDRLIAYSCLLAVLALLVRGIYGVYCRRNFSECSFTPRYDKNMVKEIASFAGWNFFGAGSAVLRDQGINVLLNVFCGPVVNAARGIAMQVNAAIHSFSGSFMSALTPQITKQYAAGDLKYCLSLCFKGARFTYYMLLMMGLPIFVEAEEVLTLWLGKIPPHAVSFVRLIIIYALTEGISSTLIRLMLATGNIKKYQIIVGGTQLLNFPIAYILLFLGLAPESTMISTIFVACLCLVARLILLRQMVGLPISDFVNGVVLNVLLVTVLSALVPMLITGLMESGAFRMVISVAVCLGWSSLVILLIGCTQSEREMITRKTINMVEKLRRK